VTAISQCISANRLPLGIGAALLLIGGLAFEFLLGLSAAVAAVLFVLVVAAALGIYRLLNRSPVAWSRPLSVGRLAVGGFVGLAMVGLLIQAVPYGWDRSNPPVTDEPAWDSPQTRELTVRACFDCHSNEVMYPWYSRIAPMSWAVELHVKQGRAKVNYSEWDRPQEEADESAETVIDGEMPPSYYTFLTHGEARLTDSETQELIDGLKATFGSSDHDEDEDEREDDN
jgi:hypothetical protein